MENIIKHPSDWTTDEYAIYEYSPELCEGYNDHIGVIGYIDETKHSYTKIFMTGFQCSGSTRKASNKKFKKYFRRKGNLIPPYIKIRTVDTDLHKVIGVCRISLYEPKYITGFNENMVLTDDQLHKFIEVISGWQFKDSSIFPDTTMWDYIIMSFNTHFDIYGIDYHIPSGLKIPNYEKMLKR